MTAIRLRRGNKADLPALAPSGTPLWCEDTKELYIGTETGVQKIGINNESGIPIGSVFPWTSTVIPDGHFECNGQAISRTIYSELFSVIGTTFGSGDGSTTFNLPDLRAEFIRGLDRGRGIDSNRQIGSSQIDSFASHSHLFADAAGGESGPYLAAGAVNWTSSLSCNTSSSGGIETRPRNIALVFIIKAKNSFFDTTVQNSNADTLDDHHASDFALANHTHTSENAFLFSTNGYTKLSNGLLIQWGTNICSTSGTDITLPAAFPNGVLLHGFSIYSRPATISLVNSSTIKATMVRIRDDDASSTTAKWVAIGY